MVKLDWRVDSKGDYFGLSETGDVWGHITRRHGAYKASVKIAMPGMGWVMLNFSGSFGSHRSARQAVERRLAAIGDMLKETDSDQG